MGFKVEGLFLGVQDFKGVRGGGEGAHRSTHSWQVRDWGPYSHNHHLTFGDGVSYFTNS